MSLRFTDPPGSQNRVSVEGNIKDTIEAILVAFMLAFIFRAFVVEAFVIPTGSMAPTLLGAHMRFRCPDCGYTFDVNYAGASRGGDDVEIPTSAGSNKVFAIFCPNCGYRLPRDNPQDPANDATDPAVRYGDRILVLKFLYLLQEPHRWDVVVFKSPVEPAHYDYSQNYIKRLVGLPGESIMILDGDVYVGKANDPNSFHIQTKPPKVQEALWRIVYDNDFQPKGLPRTELRNQNGRIAQDDPPWEEPWKQVAGQIGWDIGKGPGGRREIVFSNPTGGSALAFDAGANRYKFSLTDWLAYDVTENQSPSEADTYLRNPAEPENAVSDVKLDFYFERHSGDGPLTLHLTKRDHRFDAKIEPEQATLLMDGQPIDGPRPLSRHSGPRHIEFSNVDYHVSLRVDDQDILGTAPEQYHPDLTQLLAAYSAGTKSPKPEIQIVAAQQDSTISHLRLWRDIYYLNRERSSLTPLPWGTPEGFPNVKTQLKPDEFFVLGDNSYVSLDARYWPEGIDLPNEQLTGVAPGRVPRRFMLGKAFFVYWPAGYRPIESAPALVPDVGDMRFIH